jgi:ribose 5-phosphate isomerase
MNQAPATAELALPEYHLEQGRPHEAAVPCSFYSVEVVAFCVVVVVSSTLLICLVSELKMLAKPRLPVEVVAFCVVVVVSSTLLICLVSELKMLAKPRLPVELTEEASWFLIQRFSRCTYPVSFCTGTMFS